MLQSVSSSSFSRSCALHRVCRRGVVLCVWLVATAALRLVASDPNIYLIEPFLTNQVTLHFNTDANRTYTLQYRDNSTTGAWSNLWVAPRLSFPNHYVVPDYRTNQMRLYRLKVTP